VKLTICVHTKRLGLLFHDDILQMLGPSEEHVLPNHLFSCWASGTSMLPGGGTDAGWKPGASKIGEKS